MLCRPRLKLAHFLAHGRTVSLSIRASFCQKPWGGLPSTKHRLTRMVSGYGLVLCVVLCYAMPRHDIVYLRRFAVMTVASPSKFSIHVRITCLAQPEEREEDVMVLLRKYDLDTSGDREGTGPENPAPSRVELRGSHASSQARVCAWC